jgi:hypothetical protein
MQEPGVPASETVGSIKTITVGRTGVNNITAAAVRLTDNGNLVANTEANLARRFVP